VATDLNVRGEDKCRLALSAVLNEAKSSTDIFFFLVAPALEHRAEFPVS
jgi:hypothetical protein